MKGTIKFHREASIEEINTEDKFSNSSCAQQ